LENVPLIDKYNAYQILDDRWKEISTDFEIIETDGKSAIKAVDPNMVMKKDKEVQEGWRGRILPFELVQRILLNDEAQVIRNKEERIAEISAIYDELIEDLPEEERESDMTNDAQDAFNAKGVAARLKELKKPETQDEEELKSILLRYTDLSKEEKECKKECKELNAALHLKTKETIESLSDEQAKELLSEKWIKPLVASFIDMPNQVVSELVKEVQMLAEKYSGTLAEIEDEIEETEQELSAMIDGLTGSEFDMKGLASLKALLGGR
jgi:type I restriction enzyme M protein